MLVLDFLLLPRDELWNEEKLVLTDQRNFTVARKDVIAMLRQIGVPTDIYEYVMDSNVPGGKFSSLPPHPGVDTYCLYGTQVATNQVLDYRGKNFPDDQPTMVTIGGDGTVPHKSLSLCGHWNPQSNKIQEIAKASHNDVLQGADGIAAVTKILLSR